MINSFVLICIIIACIAFASEHKLFNPVSIMCGMWGVILYLSNLGLYTLYRAKDGVYVLFFAGIMSYTLGFYFTKLFTRNGRLRFVFRNNCTYKFEGRLNYSLAYVFFSVCVIYLLYRMYLLGVDFLKTGLNLSAISTAIRGNSSANTGILNALGFLIVDPLIIPLCIFFSIDLWMGRKDKKTIVFSMILVVLRVFTSGGRVAIIQLFIVLLIGLTFSYGKKKDSAYNFVNEIKNKKYIIPTIVVGIVSFGYLTVTKTSAAFKTIYLDFAMQPYMFQYWITHIENERAYGFASLFGFVHPILYLLKNLFHFFEEMPAFFNQIYQTIQETFVNWVKIGTTLSANAYTSVFWYLYYDGKILGILIGMFIFGCASFVFYIKAKRNKTIISVAYYAMFAISIFYSFAEIEFFKTSYILGFVYLRYLFNFKSKIEN